MKIKKILRSLFVVAIFSATVGAYKIQTKSQKVMSSSPVFGSIIPMKAEGPTGTPAPGPITLMFTGDINLGRCVASISIRAGDYNFPFHFVAERLGSADITVGSLDGSISDESPYQPCPDSMNLIAPENMAQGLQFAGFDVITVATNHIKDCGNKGFECDDKSFFDTLDQLTGNGVTPVGGGRNLGEARQPVIIEKQGIRFAFLGIDQINEKVWATENTPGVAPISVEYLEQVKADIKSAKTMADVVIVLPQWGTEYASIPDQYQRKWAQEFVEAGATLVVGNHPHIIQPVETFENGTAFYALGNFVFDQAQNHRREGVVLQATFSGAELTDWQLLPVNINYYTHQPYWVDGEDATKILARAPDLSP